MTNKFEEAVHYLEQYTYFWSSTFKVPEASRFDFRKILQFMPDNVTVTVNERNDLIFEVQICQLSRSFHPDKHYEVVAIALNKIQNILLDAYIGPM